jgi:hypothetical protein
VWCCGEHVGKLRDIIGKHAEKTKIKKFHPPTPGPLPILCPQGNKDDPSRVQVQPSHWLHEISIPKTGCHRTWPKLIPLFKRVVGMYIYSLLLISSGDPEFNIFLL